MENEIQILDTGIQERESRRMENKSPLDDLLEDEITPIPPEWGNPWHKSFETLYKARLHDPKHPGHPMGGIFVFEKELTEGEFNALIRGIDFKLHDTIAKDAQGRYQQRYCKNIGRVASAIPQAVTQILYLMNCEIEKYIAQALNTDTENTRSLLRIPATCPNDLRSIRNELLKRTRDGNRTQYERIRRTYKRDTPTAALLSSYLSDILDLVCVLQHPVLSDALIDAFKIEFAVLASSPDKYWIVQNEIKRIAQEYTNVHTEPVNAAQPMDKLLLPVTDIRRNVYNGAGRPGATLTVADPYSNGQLELLYTTPNNAPLVEWHEMICAILGSKYQQAVAEGRCRPGTGEWMNGLFISYREIARELMNPRTEPGEKLITHVEEACLLLMSTRVQIFRILKNGDRAEVRLSGHSPNELLAVPWIGPRDSCSYAQYGLYLYAPPITYEYAGNQISVRPSEYIQSPRNESGAQSGLEPLIIRKVHEANGQGKVIQLRAHEVYDAWGIPDTATAKQREHAKADARNRVAELLQQEISQGGTETKRVKQEIADGRNAIAEITMGGLEKYEIIRGGRGNGIIRWELHPIRKKRPGQTGAKQKRNKRKCSK